MKVSSKQKGFTIVEILIVIAIMGILTAIVYASLASAQAQSRDQKRLADISSIQLSLELYFNQNSGAYPATLATLVPKYLATVPVPPKGGPSGTNYAYNYFPISTSTSPTVCSSYQLWTTFEQNNSYLESKKGFNSSISTQCLGGSGISINASLPANALVYDVTP